MLQRRALLHGLAAGATCAALPPLARDARAAGDLFASEIGRDLTLIEGAGANLLVLTTSEGRVLVDSGHAAHTNDLLATLAELGERPVTVLLNTHWHLDQVGGNVALGERGATIFAHEKTRQRLTTGYYLRDDERYQAPLPPSGRPAETFYTEGATEVGGQPIEYGYLIAAHTDGDSFVAFPALDVIAAGDVLSPVRDPVFDWFGGGWLGGRVDALATLLARSSERTQFVPSQGPVMTRAEVRAEHDLMLELFERLVEHLRLGESAEDMLETGVLDGLARTFENPYKLLYDLHKGFWAHHNKLMPDIV